MNYKPNFKPNQKVDNFILEEPLGAGQDGEVWRATKTPLGKRCAIKFLNSVAQPEKKDRFDREIQILASLDHPNIVQIQDMGEAWNPVSEEIVPYYVMEFLEGRPIDKAIRELSLDYRLEGVCRLFQQVCSALEAAHARGISHGDLKPANILVVGKGQLAKLSDFGFGLLPGQEKEPRSHYPDSSYKAPKSLTPLAADIFRLGRTLTECSQHLGEIIEANSRMQILALATRMSEHSNDLSLSEASSILEQIRTSKWPQGVASQGLFETVPELSPSRDSGTPFSDPIHGVFSVSHRTLQLIDRPFFQRLRRIRQFPSADLVFPALTISAFEQALGNHGMLLRQLDALVKTSNIPDVLTPSQLSATILAGLLSSATRLPFQVPLMRVLQIDSQDLVNALGSKKITELAGPDWDDDLDVAMKILRLDARSRVPHPSEDDSQNASFHLMSMFVEGPVSASEIDWVLRASDRAGFSSPFDLTRLLGAFRVSTEGQLVVREDRLHALESFYMARIQAVERIVQQTRVRAADLMLEHAFELILYDGFDLKTLLPCTDSDFMNACLERAGAMKNRTALDLLTGYNSRILHQRLLSIPLTDLKLDYSHRPHRQIEAVLHSQLEDLFGISLEKGSLLIDIPTRELARDIKTMTKDGYLMWASDKSPSFAALRDWPRSAAITLFVAGELAGQLKPRIREVTELVHHVFYNLRFVE